MNKRYFLSLALALPALTALTSIAQTASSQEWVNAEITKLDLDKKRVMLKHERIASINMAAMTMPFKLKDAQLFAGYKIGDKVQFVVKNEEGDLFITQVRKAP